MCGKIDSSDTEYMKEMSMSKCCGGDTDVQVIL